MADVQLDPIPADKLDSLHEHQPRAASSIEEILDWIGAEPMDSRARRRRFTSGICAVVRLVYDVEWLVLWEEDPPGPPVVRFIGETGSL